MAAGPASYGMTDTLGRMHSDAQFAGSSSVPAHVEMMGLIGAGNNPMVGMTVAVAVSVEEAATLVNSNTKISCCGFFLFESKLFHLEVLVVEAVEQEVQKIRNNCLGSFAFQKIYQVVVGCRKEFDKDFSNDTNTRFLCIK